MKKRGPLLAAFCIPLLITLIICVNREIYPFGDQCMLHIDMYHQYCPFFTELMEKLKTGGSPFYSWNIGLGADFVSLYAYYLASPLNWLLILWPRGYVIEFMTVLSILKIALSGLTFTYYLGEHFHVWQDAGNAAAVTRTEKKTAVRLPADVASYAAALCGAAYALCAFMAAYAWNLMWTDCMVLAPLVILGLERLIRDNRPGLYYVSLAVCILSNYYISIMICIFLVLWFLLYWMEHRASGYRAWIRFAWYSLLAGATGAVLILPTAKVLSLSGASGISFPETMEWYFNIVSELARSLLAVDVYTGDSHWPNLYCGIFALFLLFLYVWNRVVPWKKKLPRLALVVFFWLSFSNNMLDFIWHGLHFPTSLPGRQSFLYAFLVLVIAYEALLYIRELKLWQVFAAGGMSVVFLLFCNHFMDETTMEQTSIWASGAFFACYFVIVLGILIGKKRIRQLMLATGGLAVVAELVINYNLTGLDTISRTDYVKNLADYRAVLSETAKKSDEDSVFYRTEELERKTKNDAALSGYHSGTQFSSLMNLNVSHFYQDVGMEGGKNFYCAGGATPLLSAMLSIRYVLADNAMEEGPLRTLVAQRGDTYLYENAYVLPLGFMMDEDVAEKWDYAGGGDIGTQNQLANLLGSDRLLLTAVESESKAGESSFVAQDSAYYYATYSKTGVDNLQEQVSSGRTRGFTKVSHGYILDLGYCEAGEEVKVTNTANELVQLVVYRLDLMALRMAYEALAAQTVEVTEVSDTRVKGNVDVTQAGRLIFSIADEDGWTLYVDGKKTDSETFGSAFISTYLTEGTHEFELRYKSPGFLTGAVISAAAVVLFAATMAVRRKRKKG